MVQNSKFDLNNDGIVNVQDINEAIGVILSGNQNPNYDVNGDGEVDINDVTYLIDSVLEQEQSTEPTPWDGVQEVTISNNVFTFKMIPVEPGTFIMGAPSTQLGSGTNERPQHKVTITKKFWLSEGLVTQDLWHLIMNNNPSGNAGLNKQLPVEKVSWEDCQTFITKLNQLTGKSFRLPTEAEWEFAARGGNFSKGYIFSGSNDQKEVAWYKTNSGGTTQPIGQKKSNELGLYDMSGNVCEWVSDLYGQYSSADQVDPTGATSGRFRVYRNGSYQDTAAKCRISYRYPAEPTYKRPFLGFRLALTEE